MELSTLVVCALLCLSFAELQLGASAAAAALGSVTYRFTARSFLPAGCFRDYNELNRIWNYTAVGKTGNRVDYPNFFSTDIAAYVGSNTGTTSVGGVTGDKICVIWNDIVAGNYNGHPDFEVFGEDFYAQGCSGTTNPLTNVGAGQPCKRSDNTATAKLSKIVENDLVTHTDGLPKPRYCTSNGVFPQDPRCGWRIPSSTNADKIVTTSGRQFFDMWYRDNAVYNLRSGFTLKLTETSAGSKIFEYATTGFFPTAPTTPCLATVGRTLNCANGGKTFPYARKSDAQEDNTKQFSFTSEHHSFFELRGNEKFTFEGDDDVWVYLNEKLAVDVGGLHSPALSTIDLSVESVRQALGMQIGGVYALDMYHAERRSSGSNFRIQTGLTGGCNILQSGKSAYVWSPATVERDWKLIGGPTWGIVKNNRIVLTTSGEKNTAGYAFLRQQVNVGTGFVVTFSFTASAKGEGFVFVLQRDDLVDINGGSGGHLGFRNALNSVGIVFDMCVDRDVGNLANPDCKQREIRMHYLPNGGANSATAQTKNLTAPLYLPVIPNDGAVHTVTVNYFAKSPPWLEVLMDNDLLLQRRNIDLDQVIGGRNAFVGFTGSTGFTASTVNIFDFNVSSVQIEDSRTQALGIPQVITAEPIVNGTADGRRPVSFVLQNFDACQQRIEFGGFAHRARGVLTLRERDNSTGAAASPSRRQLQGSNNATDGYVIVADIVDRDDGKYTLEFKSTVAGVYDLQIWYGVGCFSNGNNTGTVLPNPSNSTCFRVARNRSAVFSPVPPPLLPPEDSPAQGLPQSALIGIGVAAGIVAAVGSVLLIVGVRFRNRWRRDKAFIEAGRQAVAERDVQYLGDGDLDALQQRLQATLHAIHAERAKKMQEGDKQSMIDELNRQRGEIQEQVRRLKVKLNGGDPNEPPPGFATRVRKSFAATRVSRGFSTRLSRGFSLMQGNPAMPESGAASSRIEPYGGGELSSGNPLFQRMSMSLGLSRGPRAPPDV